jgi:AcrR family transcriptional regulator
MMSSQSTPTAASRSKPGSGPNRADKLSRQGQRSRAALLRAARRVFERRGYHETRIADITASARMAVGSFYTYFDSKEEIFEALLIEMENLVYDDPGRQLPDTAAPLERIRATNEVYFTTYQRNARFWGVIEEASLRAGRARDIQAARHMESRERTFRALQSWQAQGLIEGDVDLAFTAECLGAMTERCAYLWFVHGEPVDLPSAIDKITKVWGDALGLRPTPQAPKPSR